MRTINCITFDGLVTSFDNKISICSSIIFSDWKKPITSGNLKCIRVKIRLLLALDSKNYKININVKSLSVGISQLSY
jgi:hypothetical protein